MQTANLDDIVPKLCTASRCDLRGTCETEWPRSVAGEWCMSPELTSLYGSDLYDQLDDKQRRQLAFYECINFFSLNINGEKALIEGIARRLYRKTHLQISPYLHHFIDEENKHMRYFASFCLNYAGTIYPERKLSFEREYASGEEDFLFFSKIMIFEEIVDAYNLRMALDVRLAPIVRHINEMHHKDEARHLVFGRHLVEKLFTEGKNKWNEEKLRGIRTYISAYISSTWREYYNQDIYSDVGLPDPFSIAQCAYAAESSREHRSKLSAGLIGFLLRTGILSEEPVL